ncbi:MAG: hypothetical protein U0P45_07580 [Acidimicrobiales bacterium]
MRLGDLVGRLVLDRNGAVVGRVRDVRAVPDGPHLGLFGPALRVDGLVATGRFGRRPRLVPWEHVVLPEGPAAPGPIVVDLPVDALEAP